MNPQESKESEFDVVVIGSGPGGEGAAMQATKSSMRVAMVEKHPRIGGGCTHWGTIPSKALRFAIFQITEFSNQPLLRRCVPDPLVTLNYPDLRKSAAAIIEKQEAMRQGFYTRNHVPVIHGQARFLEPTRIEVEKPDGRKRILNAKHTVLAVGARPYRPTDVSFAHPRIFDSDTILEMSFTPKSMMIYGAGVIGCEYASMFRNLG